MAKETKDGKIQFVFVNVEGDQETLQETLRQIGTVLNRGMNPAMKKPLQVVNSKALTSPNGTDGNSEQVHDGLAENVTDDEELFTAKPKKKWIPKTPSLLKDFDPDSGNVSFKDFVKQKNPSTIQAKYLVVAGWFKDQSSVDEITTSHIFTCFKLMDWVPPDDMAQTFRNIKKTRQYFENGSQNGHWKISILGLNALAKMTTTPTD